MTDDKAADAASASVRAIDATTGPQRTACPEVAGRVHVRVNC
jgi:hypothetical protein